MRCLKCVIFVSALLWMSVIALQAQIRWNVDTILIRVVDKDIKLLSSVHFILEPREVLLSVTDSDGFARLPVEKLTYGNKIRVTSVGYKSKTIPLERLHNNTVVTLETEIFNLDEVLVIGMRSADILKNARKNTVSSKRKMGLEYYEKYFGNAQYMKITECFGRAVEFRREYGCFLTTGNVRRNSFYENREFEERLNTSSFRKRIMGNDNFMTPEQQIFRAEAEKILGSDDLSSLFTRAGAGDLSDVVKRLEGRSDVSDDYIKQLKIKNYREETFDRYDMEYDFSFVPAYSQRSFPWDAWGEDTLSVFCTSRFDAGSNKLFTVMRCIYLYAPVFSSSSLFDFRVSNIQDTSGCHVINFETKMKKYPRFNPMYAQGTIWIDRKSGKLTKMNINRCYYHLYRLDMRLGALPDFETAVVAIFDYDEDNVCYIKSCRVVTTWLEAKDIIRPYSILSVESPSRESPSEVQLREVEGINIYSFNKIPSENQVEAIGKSARQAAKNPAGEYNVQLFDSLPYLWNCSDALANLNRFMPFREQFRLNSGKPYYNKDNVYIRLGESAESRQKILLLFFKDKK